MGEGLTVSIVNGPWQAISLSAALGAQGGEPPWVVLVDMDPDSELLAATREVLRANGFTRSHVIPAKTPVAELARAARALAEAMGRPLAEVCAVATYGVHRPVARYLLSAMPASRVLIYEEGLRTYVPQHGDLRERTRLRLAAAWGRIDREFGRAWRRPPQPAGAWRYALLLSGRLGLPPGISMEQVAPVARAQLTASVGAVPEPAVRGLPDRYGVIVGQYYARLGQMSEDDELSAYLRAARRLVASGLVPVWRGHIREADTLFTRLKAACPELRSFRELVADSRLPLECHRSVFGPACRAVVSFSSSALFYVPYLYEVPAFTLLTPAQVRPMHHPHRDACLLALEHVPQLERLEEVP